MDSRGDRENLQLQQAKQELEEKAYQHSTKLTQQEEERIVRLLSFS